MPLDALCLTAVAAELRAAVAGGKIDKLYQPTRDEVVLYVRGQGENVRLLLSANPGHPRANLTTLNRENPEQPPMFCMLLRKHLQGARILELNQPPLERILEFRLETLDELGDRVERRLVLEAMGRSANLLLLDGEGRIIDCIRRVDGDLGRGQRQLLPGLFYRQPPEPDKLNPFTIEPEELRLVLENPLGKEWDKLLLDSFTGLSPLVARELEYLNSVLENLSLAEGERDLQEIRQELVETGYLRRGKTAAKRQKRVSGKPMEFRSSAGLRISVGKNNSQNDQLTTKLAYKSDIWLHTQKIHGSHVILWLEGGEADAQSLTEAAILAATFSQAGEGSRVPVDYTPVKYVKKPAGARPGMVVYTTYQTAVVDPDPELAKQLRVK